MASEELDSAIVQNISEIDAIMKHTQRVSDAIFRELDSFIISVLERTDWYVVANWGDGGSIWFAPNGWRTPGTDKPDDFSWYFEFDLAYGDTDAGLPNEDFFYLTRLCRVGLGEVGFHFRQSAFRRPIARRTLPSFSDQLRPYGFVINDQPTFFRPTSVSSDALSEGILLGNLNNAFQPVASAIEHIVEAKPAFDALIRSLSEAD